MNITVDPASPVPAFEQVRAQLADLIAFGSLAPGFRLPPIRQLAQDLGLAPGTVARVYKELEAAKLIASRVRHGTVVLPPPAATARQSQDLLAEAAAGYAATAQRLNLDLDTAQQALTQAWSRQVK